MFLSPKDGLYIFIDPFNRPDSGVTSYTKLAATLIEEAGFEIEVIGIDEGESLESFAVRAAHYVSTCNRPICCVEAPESLAASRFLPNAVPLHIRLHCSRSLGSIVQGLPYSSDAVRLEQGEINRATRISSPSWAAYYASSELFSFNKDVSIYPNPAPVSDDACEIECPYDVAFVGRFQRLKGVDALIEICKKYPLLKFVAICPLTEKTALCEVDNLKFIDGQVLTKSSIYSLAPTVIIPSIFETFSMVAIEALAAGRNVVIWRHLGVCEYFRRHPRLFQVKPGSMRQLSKVLRKSIKRKPVESEAVVIKNTRLWFAQGWTQMWSNSAFTNSAKPTRTTEKYIRNLANPSKPMQTKRSKLFKKTHKLIFHPVQFFRDSSEAKYFREKSSERKLKKLLELNEQLKDHPEVKALKVEHSSANAKPDIGLPKPSDKASAALPNPAAKPVAALPKPAEKPRLQAPAQPDYFTRIKSEGRIESTIVETKPLGYAVGFLHGIHEDSARVKDLLDNLSAFSDFPYTNRSRMKVGVFENLEAQSALSIANRIDVKNKVSFSLLDYIVLIDAPAVLCMALRYIGTNQRIILVRTNSDLVVNPESVDTLITTTEVSNQIKFRRFIRVESEQEVHIAIRRALQEAFPRKRDMLLSLSSSQGRTFERSEFVGFDENTYQGILKVTDKALPKSASMTELCEHLAGNVKAVAVLESVYMKYRSQCEAVERGASPYELIVACLKDGVLFDVKAS